MEGRTVQHRLGRWVGDFFDCGAGDDAFARWGADRSEDFEGWWRGGGGWKGELYSIDSGDASVISSIAVQGAEVRFAIASIEASYAGKLSDDGASMAGMWTQGSGSYALNLARVSGGG